MASKGTFILSHNDIFWYVRNDARLVGYHQDVSEYFKFNITNPPEHTSKDYSLFVAVCDFAVAQGVLQKRSYYVIEEFPAVHNPFRL